MAHAIWQCAIYMETKKKVFFSTIFKSIYTERNRETYIHIHIYIYIIVYNRLQLDTYKYTTSSWDS